MEKELLVQLQQVDGTIVNVPESEYFRLTGRTISHGRIVYGYLDEHPMDTSEIEDAKLLLYLEIYTIQSVDNSYDFFVNESLSIDQFNPVRYVFTVTGERNSYIDDVCANIIRNCRDNHGWVKGSILQNTKANVGVPGHLSYSAGETSEEMDCVFVAEALSEDDRAVISRVDATYESVINISNLPSEIPNIIPKLEKSNPDSANRPYTVTVYKVGHGNTITIQKDNKCILFDCGTFPYTTNLKSQISLIKPDIIIFSHWHCDHYDFLNDVDDSNLKLVIFPCDTGKIKPTFKRVKQHLGYFQRCGIALIQLDRIAPPIPSSFLENYGFENIDLFVGENKPAPATPQYGVIGYDRSDDDSGILLSIKSCCGSSHAILPGDCSYYSWPDQLQNELSDVANLVVPHHGGHIITITPPNPPQSSLAQIYMSDSDITFKDRYKNPATLKTNESSSAHRTFINNAFTNQQLHLTQLLANDRISFDI